MTIFNLNKKKITEVKSKALAKDLSKSGIEFFNGVLILIAYE